MKEPKCNLCRHTRTHHDPDTGECKICDCDHYSEKESTVYTQNSIPFLRSSLIYKAKRGHIYDPENKQYDCFRPANDGRYSILDCWVCDVDGNVHPGYNVSPVPVSWYAIGKAVNAVRE